MNHHLRVASATLCALLLALPAHAATAGGAALDTLARDTERAEAIRAVKNLQYAYAQYAQFGLWAEMGALFSADGELVWGAKAFKGPAAITRYNQDTFGAGRPGLPAGVMNTLFIEVPLVNLSVDGNSARARWYGLHMLGGATDARWEGGTFENEYVKDQGRWKISRLHFTPQFGGPYETGMRLLENPLALVPYHFATADVAGTPIPPPVGAAPKTRATLAGLEQRIDALNAEDKVRNLQNAWGHYVDRRMWDDVTDLFTSDGVLEIGGVGIYDGPASIRRALERMGPAGLDRGQLNDHPLFDTLIEVAPGGMQARVRSLELGLIGDQATGMGFWTVSVHDNRFVKQGGAWKIREMRVFPLLKTDYYLGWGRSRIVDAAPEKPFAPDRPVPAADSGTAVIPALLRHPVTGREAAYPAGAKVVARAALLSPLPVPRAAAPSGSAEARIAEAARRLAMSAAYDGAMNMTASYTFYLDDGQWTSLGAAFAQRGAKQVPNVGFYIGPERIAHRTGATPAMNSTNPGRGGWHWLLQPVVDVAADGRSAKMRTRLFHPLPSNSGGSLEGGMYPNNQAVLENGAWKLWSVTIDEAYFSAQFPNGWARAAQRPAAGAAPARGPAAIGTGTGTGTGAAAAAPPSGTGAAASAYPPDITLTALGRRMEGFAGGPGDTVRWPGILPMWFHYRNPVSGRVPPLYWPNCGTCEYAPQTSMDKHGWLLPES